MSKVRFNIGTEDGPRTLFTANERPNGDLVFDLKPPPFFRLPGGATPHRIERQKYSVHRSLQTTEGNTITQRTFYPDRGPSDHYHFSRALKQRDCFAPLFVRRYPDLRQLTPVAVSPANQVDLGEVEAECFQLILGTYVANADRTFNPTEHINISVAQHRMTHFRIVVLWSFLTIPSHDSGDIAHVFTQRPELVDDPEEREVNELTMNGFDEAGCIQGMAEATSRIVNRFFAEHFEALPGPLRTLFSDCVKLLQTGRRDTPEWQKYMEQVVGPARERFLLETT
jgi:hypothetical protein